MEREEKDARNAVLRAEKEERREKEMKEKAERKEKERKEKEERQEKERKEKEERQEKERKEKEEAMARKKEEDERKAAERKAQEEERARKNEEELKEREEREQKAKEAAAVAAGAALAGGASKVEDDKAEPTREATDDAKEVDKSEPAREIIEEPKADETPEATRDVTKHENEPSREPPMPVDVAEPDSNREQSLDSWLQDQDEDEATREVPTEESKVSHEEPPAEPTKSNEAAQEEPKVSREVTGASPKASPEAKKDESKEKPAKPGMLSRIRSRLGRRDEDKRTAEPAKTAPAPTREVKEADKAEAVTDKQDEPADDDAVAVAVATMGTGVAAAGGMEAAQADQKEEPAAAEPEVKTKDYATDEETQKRDEAGTSAGVAALGPVVAAGAVENDKGKRESGEREAEDQKADVSSLSTDDELYNDSDAELEGVASTEHTGAYNFASPSPGVEKKPDLMRHISTIQDSSDSEPPTPGVTDTDDENVGRLEPRPTMIEQPREQHNAEKQEEPTQKDTTLVTETVPSSVPEDKEGAEAETPVSPVSPLAPEEEAEIQEAKVVVVNKEASHETPQIVNDPATTTSKEEEGAPAPVVAPGPSKEERAKSPSKDEKDKDKKGIRGFFRKIRNKSKSEDKPGKTEGSSASEKSFQGGAKYTGKEDAITPVASASTGNGSQHVGIDGPIGDPEHVSGEDGDPHATDPSTSKSIDNTAQEPTAEHMGTDGPIGDDRRVSGMEGEPGAASPSSFKRHDEDINDPDDVSSSGAEEEDLTRGRGGRGVTSDKGKERADITSTGEEEQSEEARDQFDESLAPPPAFAGQAKSESPVRETRFQEQF